MVFIDKLTGYGDDGAGQHWKFMKPDTYLCREYGITDIDAWEKECDRIFAGLNRKPLKMVLT